MKFMSPLWCFTHPRQAAKMYDEATTVIAELCEPPKPPSVMDALGVTPLIDMRWQVMRQRHFKKCRMRP